MNSATWTLFFAVLIGASCGLDTKSCTSFKPRDLTVPEKMDDSTVCGKMYTNSSCCSNKTASYIESRNSSILNENVFCGGGDQVSPGCQNGLKKYACLIECSPELGRSGNITSQFKGLPICNSSCEWLYNECAEDIICTMDLSHIFDGSASTCKEPRTCEKIGSDEAFKTAKDFCGSFRTAVVTTSDVNCFDLKTGKYVEEADGADEAEGASAFHIFKYMGLAVLAILICLAMCYAVMYVMKKHRLSRGL